MSNLFFFFFLLLLAHPALADPQSIGLFKGWKTFQYGEKTGLTCYMILHPVKQEWVKEGGQTTTSTKKNKKAKKQAAMAIDEKRTEAYFMITLRPAESSDPTINYVSGYIFKQGSDAHMRIDKQNFSLFTNKDGAWARNSAIDKNITEALVKGNILAIKGLSAKGNTGIDGFILNGADAAYKAIRKTCGM